MKKIDWTKLGGFPLDQDDFEKEQDGFEEADVAIARVFDNGSASAIILSGLDWNISGSSFIVDEGYVLMNGKICYSPSVTFDVATSYTNRFQFTYSSDEVSGNDKTFENGNVEPILFRDVATLAADGTVTTGAFPFDRMLLDLTYAPQVLAEKQWKVNQSDWASLSGVVAEITTPAVSGEESLRYHKDGFGYCELKGTFKVTNTLNTANKIFTIPNYSSSKIKVVYGIMQTPQNNVELGIRILTNGDVYFYPSFPMNIYPATTYFSLEGVRWRI